MPPPHTRTPLDTVQKLSRPNECHGHQSQHASAPRFTPHIGSCPMTPLYLIGFIEDTKRPFIFWLGGELEVVNVLCNNLPVGDEVALEVASSQCGLEAEDTPLTTQPRNSYCKSLRQPKGAPAFPRGCTSQTPMSQVSIRRWERGWMLTTYLFAFLASTCSLFTPQNGWTPFWFGDQTRTLFPGS